MREAEIESKRLLVVDDDAAVLKLLKLLLTRAKYRVAGCESASEALKLLSQAQYDLMITDAIMPTMSGFDLVRAVRNNPSFGQLPILMLTRKNERSDVRKALEAGVTDYILKPIDEQLLLDKVEASFLIRDSEHRLREVSIHGRESLATAGIEVSIVSLRETGMVIRFPFKIPENAAFQLTTPIFEQIGIRPPLMKILAGGFRPSENPEEEGDPFTNLPWEAEFTFVGVSETDLRKIRTWLQKQEIQRKK